MDNVAVDNNAALDNKEGHLKRDGYDYSLESIVKDPLVVGEPATLSEIASQGAGRGCQFSRQVDAMLADGHLVPLLLK